MFVLHISCGLQLSTLRALRADAGQPGPGRRRVPAAGADAVPGAAPPQTPTPAMPGAVFAGQDRPLLAVPVPRRVRGVQPLLLADHVAPQRGRRRAEL